jgi:micrococcal nuclease
MTRVIPFPRPTSIARRRSSISRLVGAMHPSVITLTLVAILVVGLVLTRMADAPWASGASSGVTLLSGSKSSNSTLITPDRIHVIDGDTVRLDGQTIRLVGFNAPETVRPECDRERELGDRATQRVRQLVANGRLELDFLPCSCPPGTQGTPSCNYGRRCASLRAHGRDVGAVLIAEGLAVPFHCGGTRCPPTPRSWCG